MKFKIIKASLDGIVEDGKIYTDIKEVLTKVSSHNIPDLFKLIEKWSKTCKVGEVYCTHTTAIIAVGIEALDYDEDICRYCGHEGLDYEELSPVEDGSINQVVNCPKCGKQWEDVFVLSEQNELYK